MNVVSLELADLEIAILHRVGNKSRDEGNRPAKKVMDLNKKMDTSGMLQEYFLKGLNENRLYEFNHEHDLEANPVFNYCRDMFERNGLFIPTSVSILKHLYEKSNNPKIKSGELYVTYFADCVINDEIVDAIGIFKSEVKEPYLRLNLDQQEEWEVDFDEGAALNKMDKGCLIFNTDEETGYKIIGIDLKKTDAAYWNDDFLTITEVQNDSFHTKAYMDLCKEFAAQGFKLTNKDEKVAFVNNAKDYFNHYKEFDEGVFKEVVFGEEYDKIDAFEEKKQDFQEKLGIEDTAEETFYIDKKAVQKGARGWKDKIVLDTQIEIRVLGSQAHSEGFLERGHDKERNLNYYKVYFTNEK